MSYQEASIAAFKLNPFTFDQVEGKSLGMGVYFIYEAFSPIVAYSEPTGWNLLNTPHTEFGQHLRAVIQKCIDRESCEL